MIQRDGMVLSGKPHVIIDEYDQRVRLRRIENLVGEAKREGLNAIPPACAYPHADRSAKFKNNYAFFQIVMLAYNIWRYLKIMANNSMKKDQSDTNDSPCRGLKGIMDNTIRIARLKLLYIAAKVVKDSNVDKVKYSIHDTRTPRILNFFKFLDTLRFKARPWEHGSSWPYRFAVL